MRSVSIRAIVLSTGLVASLSAAAAADVVTDWNQIALNTIQSTSTSPPAASRALAMVQAAVFDAVNGIDGSYESYRFRPNAPINGAQREAAAVAAAHNVLVNLFPTQAATLNTARTNSISNLPVLGRSEGEAVGDDIGTQMRNWRSTDGSTSSSTYQVTNPPQVGRWRPTPPANANPLLPQWGQVTPFALTGGAQFRPPAPPAINSAAYTAAYNEVKALGAATGSTRTPEQTDIARAWAYGGGTVTPPGGWNQIAQQVITGNVSLVDRARTYAMLNVAMADAAIACWEAKYTFDMWRPITAIQQGDTDGNNDTTGDAAWTSLLVTPPFPTYTSGHSTFSRAAATILSNILGGDAIDIMMQGDFGVIRHLTSLNAAANEAGRSRIYGGIHFEFDNVFAQECGLSVSQFVISNYFQIPAPGTAALLGLAGLVAMRRRR